MPAAGVRSRQSGQTEATHVVYSRMLVRPFGMRDTVRMLEGVYRTLTDVNLYRFEGNDPTQLPQPDSSDSMDASAGSMPGAPSSDGVFPTLDVRLSLSPTDPSTWQDPDELDQSSSLPDPDQYSGSPLGAGFNPGTMPAPQGPVFDPGSIAAQLSTPVNPFTLATPSTWMLPALGALDNVSDYAKLASRVLTLTRGIDPADILRQLTAPKVLPADNSFFRLLYAQTGLGGPAEHGVGATVKPWCDRCWAIRRWPVPTTSRSNRSSSIRSTRVTSALAFPGRSPLGSPTTDVAVRLRTRQPRVADEPGSWRWHSDAWLGRLAAGC